MFEIDETKCNRKIEAQEQGYFTVVYMYIIMSIVPKIHFGIISIF